VNDSFFINLHKGLVIPVVVFLMWRYQNFSLEMWIYLALHGSYSILWLLKQAWYPDKRFMVSRPAWIGLPFIFLPLASYYVAPYLLASDPVSLPPPVIAGAIALFTFGVFFHYVGDAQKFYELRAEHHLVSDGLFSRTRNPGYFGEILIYSAFATISAHWLSFVIVAAWAALFFLPGIIAKERSLSRYPDYAAWKARSWPLIPRPW